MSSIVKIDFSLQLSVKLDNPKNRDLNAEFIKGLIVGADLDGKTARGAQDRLEKLFECSGFSEQGGDSLIEVIDIHIEGDE